MRRAISHTIAEVERAFLQLRTALSTEPREALYELVDQIEELCRRSFGELQERARFVADANVSAVQMLIQRDDTSTRLRQENSLLSHKTRALAEANADAVQLLCELEDSLNETRIQKRKLERLTAELERGAFRDRMTGLYNFAYFAEQSEQEFARAKRHDHELSLLFFDVDHFKGYNDRNGHLAGNAVLQTLAGILLSGTRAADIKARNDSFAVRYGGEEFVLVLPNTPLEGALIVAERMRAAVADYSFPGGEHQPLGRVTISVGVAARCPADDDLSALTKRADDAVYRAKRAGRNTVRT